jgi:hypothetical protein
VERRFSVKRVVLTAVFLTLLVAAMGAGDEQLVLIVSANSKIGQLNSQDLRKLFLGLTVVQEGHRLRPMLNESDARIKEAFLQNIVSMSDITYDRSVLRLTLLQGKSQPTAYKQISELLNSVAADPDAVSYSWSTDVVSDVRIRIVRVLWYD